MPNSRSKPGRNAWFGVNAKLAAKATMPRAVIANCQKPSRSLQIGVKKATGTSWYIAPMAVINAKPSNARWAAAHTNVRRNAPLLSEGIAPSNISCDAANANTANMINENGRRTSVSVPVRVGNTLLILS